MRSRWHRSLEASSVSKGAKDRGQQLCASRTGGWCMGMVVVHQKRLKPWEELGTWKKRRQPSRRQHEPTQDQNSPLKSQ